MKAYISGPMSGLKDHNLPAFAEAAAKLRDLGFFVINPGENNGGLCNSPRKDYLRQDMFSVLQVDRLYVLPGFENSPGAKAEILVAQELEIEVFDYTTMLPLSFDVQTTVVPKVVQEWVQKVQDQFNEKYSVSTQIVPRIKFIEKKISDSIGIPSDKLDLNTEKTAREIAETEKVKQIPKEKWVKASTSKLTYELSPPLVLDQVVGETNSSGIPTHQVVECVGKSCRKTAKEESEGTKPSVEGKGADFHQVVVGARNKRILDHINSLRTMLGWQPVTEEQFYDAFR